MECLRIKELFKGASRGKDRDGCGAACASKAGTERKGTEQKCEEQEMRAEDLKGRRLQGRGKEGRKAPSLGSHGYTRHSVGVRMPVHHLSVYLC